MDAQAALFIKWKQFKCPPSECINSSDLHNGMQLIIKRNERLIRAGKYINSKGIKPTERKQPEMVSP